MHKENIQFGLAGLFVGLVIVGGIFVFFQPTPRIEQSEKMKECIKSGGEFRISDWSMKDDGSDYRATCEIPEHYIWNTKIN